METLLGVFRRKDSCFFTGTAFEKMICEKIVRQTKKISVPFRCYFGIFITFVEPAGAYARPIVTVGIPGVSYVYVVGTLPVLLTYGRYVRVPLSCQSLHQPPPWHSFLYGRYCYSLVL